MVTANSTVLILPEAILKAEVVPDPFGAQRERLEAQPQTAPLVSTSTSQIKKNPTEWGRTPSEVLAFSRPLLAICFFAGMLLLGTGCSTGIGKTVTFGSDIAGSGQFIFIRAPYGMLVRRSAGFLIHPPTRLCFVWINVSVGEGNGTGLSRVPCANLAQDPRIAPHLTWLLPKQTPTTRPVPR